MQPQPDWRGNPVFIPELCSHLGIPLQEYPGWRWRGQGTFHTIRAVMWHHTGHHNTSPDTIARNPALGGALSATFHLDPVGLSTLCGAGIAWHAGRGRYDGWPINNANPMCLGIEMQHNGTDPWPDEQLDAARRVTAALLWFLGHDASTATVLGHWEYSGHAQGKWDPGAGDGVVGHVMDMDAEREAVGLFIHNLRQYGQLDPPAAA